MCLFLFEIEVDDLGEKIVVGPGKKSLVLGVYSLSILAKEADPADVSRTTKGQQLQAHRRRGL